MMDDPQVKPVVVLAGQGAVIDAALRIALVTLLVVACYKILQPFTGILLWSLVLAVIIYPLHVRLTARLGNRMSAVLIGVVSAAFLLVPVGIAATSLSQSLYGLVTGMSHETILLPPLPPGVEKLPLIGPRLVRGWLSISNNMPDFLANNAVELREAAVWLGGFAGGLAGDALSFVGGLVVAAIMVAHAPAGIRVSHDVFARVTSSDDRGARLVTLTAKTIRGVGQGVVGVAVIQALLIGIGLFAMGIPFAGALTLILILIGVVQLPALIVTLPAMIYVFYTSQTTPAVIFAVYITIVGFSDSMLKPLLLGRGLEVPMPIILIGVIGGMIADGLVGLFIGPVILGVGYVLFMEWLRPRPEPSTGALAP